MDQEEVFKKKNKKYKIIFGILIVILIAIIVFFFIHNDYGRGSLPTEQQKVYAFNSAFIEYSGNNVKGTNVKTIISSVINSNIRHKEDAKKQITVIKGNANNILENNRTIQTSEELVEMRKEINLSKMYNVSLKYGPNGMIIGVGIEKVEEPNSITNSTYDNTSNNTLNK